MIKRLSSRIFIRISYEVCLRARCPPLVWAEARKLGCTGCGKRITLTWIISQDLIKVGQLMMTEQNKLSTFLRTCLWSSHKSGFVLQSVQNPKIDQKAHHHPDPDAGCEEESGHNALSGKRLVIRRQFIWPGDRLSQETMICGPLIGCYITISPLIGHLTV